MKPVMILSLCALVFVSFSGVLASATPSGVVDEAHERAMKRQYPGGSDEEDLKVQDELVQPKKKYDEKSIEAEVVKSLFKDKKGN